MPRRPDSRTPEQIALQARCRLRALGQYVPRVELGDFERGEWSRMANALASQGYLPQAERYHAAATYAHRYMPLSTYDTLMTGYRAWLVFGHVED